MLIPYYSWETDAVETWLEDKAESGWELTEIKLHFAGFRRAAPQKLRYRLDWQELGYQSSAEAEYLSLCRDAGWEYVCKLGDAFLFRTADGEAAELQSDPEVYKQSIRKMLRNSEYGISLTLTAFFCALWAQYVPLRNQNILVYLVDYGILPFVCLAATALLEIFIVADVYIARAGVKKRLKSGIASEHRFRAPRKARLRIAAAICIVLLLGISSIRTHDAYDFRYIRVNEASSLPVPLLSDIAPKEAAELAAAKAPDPVTHNFSVDWDELICKGFTLPAPERVWIIQGVYRSQGAEVWQRNTQFNYSVRYHKLLCEKLAVELENNYVAALSSAVLTPLADSRFDTALYTKNGGMQVLVLRQGRFLAEVSYSGSADLTQCLDIFARRLTK